MRRWSFIVLAACTLARGHASRAQLSDLAIHDPSTIVRRDSTYWVFGTGFGVPAFSSTDRVHWTQRGTVVEGLPAWAKEAVPGNTRGYLWAPDVRKVGGRYLLYYSVSTFGSNVSAIGLATSATLEPGSWKDEGEVFRSRREDNFNAIDPCVAESADGRLWLGFGSFWSGINLIELDPATGKRKPGPIYPLASHPQDPERSIEAAFIHQRAGWYYLFVNWDRCCRGARSTYNIRVGRSHDITGPYLDKAGVDMARGGGTLFLGSKPDDGSGAPFDDKVGPGHAGILRDGGTERFSFHWEYVRGQNRPMLEIRDLRWTTDGWPELAATAVH